MAMTTRCPVCATTFRVTSQELKAYSGKVRCGQCAQIFDAYSNLGTVADEGPVLKTEPQPEESAQQSPPEAEPVIASEPPEGTSEPISESLVVVSDFVEPAPKKKKRWPWVIGIFVLSIALVLQVGYWFRTDLSARYPGLKRPLQQLCSTIQCSVGLPQQIDSLDIEESDLQPQNQAKPNLLVFTAVIRNRASVSQAFPALELSITDSQNNLIARRVFLPKDYLAKNQGAEAGIRAKGDLSIHLNLDIGKLNAAGYRVYLFYP